MAEIKTVKPTSTSPKAPSPTKKMVLPPAIFGIKVNTQAIFDAIMSERAAQRQGTHEVKNRAQVRGGGRKP